MPDDTTQSEAKLRKLAERLHRGWEKLHPVTEKELAAVRQVVREQWEHEEKIRLRLDKAEEAEKARQAKRTVDPKKDEAQEHDQERDDHSHGQDH